MYFKYMTATDKPLVWLRDEVRTPPFSATARLETCRQRLRSYDNA